ncbi:2-amino-4-hydroxy-6-hydroxymethyldihydropteridine diphosphokinase [Halalkalibacter urbisdiaboli]|uniref:2-amino-4-hydroxy-6- hydroxymethyldihydropteridine diphosphokinase n=1 Tax=Halalkalibacter urbisdiaboli TaxID=1960589 RepID=UPI000B44ABDD|nr:2-amino-4-hydroxy-6-hydroxymethyldihydropteridine diphosphokinase [Halalkalibacter urbisdiaboli]
MKDVYLALGSNIGDREAYLEKAIRELSAHPQIEVKQASSIYETEPIGYVEQQAFLNMVIYIRTNLSPQKLLAETQAIEQLCGRKRDIHWGPRTLDLDILLYDEENMKMENLCIPHPRMWERAFVVVPLMQLNPSLYSESLNKSIAEVYKELPDKEGVIVWKRTIGGEGLEPSEN